MIRKPLARLRFAIAVAALLLLASPCSFGWGKTGHKMVNRLGAESLPADVPAFLRAPGAIREIEYLGPEPDRWRSPAEPELKAVQAPDHAIDLEYADLIGTLPRRRYDYIAELYAAAARHPELAKQLRPEKVGFQPYITNEVWERLKSAMRDYRELRARHASTRAVQAAILFYAGWLGITLAMARSRCMSRAITTAGSRSRTRTGIRESTGSTAGSRRTSWTPT